MTKNIENTQPIAIFDFDGTITKKSTTYFFLKFIYGTSFITKSASQMHSLFLYYCKIIDIDQLNQIIAKSFFKGLSKDYLYHQGKVFSENILPNLIKESAFQQIKWHKNQGHYCILATSAYNIYIDHWSKQNGFDNLVSTKIEFNGEGLATGYLDGKSCYGAEKLKRVIEVIGKEPKIIYAYGDSAGDKEILDYATHPHYRTFK